MYTEGRSKAEGLDALPDAKGIGNYVPHSARLVSQQNEIFRPYNPESSVFHAALQAEGFAWLEAGSLSTAEGTPQKQLGHGG